jgi:hypothetical protein
MSQRRMDMSDSFVACTNGEQAADGSDVGPESLEMGHQGVGSAVECLVGH